MLSLEDKSMKMSRIALAMLVAAPLAAANAGVTVTPLLIGYTWQDSLKDLNDKDYHAGADAKLKGDMFTGAALGVELTPWLGFEVEYSQVKGDLETYSTNNGFQSNGQEYKQENIAGNFYVTSDLITKNYDSKIKPYVLLGAGHSKVKPSGTSTFDKYEGTIGNAGVGAFWQLNDVLSVRTEARATYNEAVKNWNYTALAGLNVVLGGHLKPAAPVVEVAEVVVAAPVVQEQLTEDLNLELRVFFDTNKSNIKPQYQPEIAKVAEALTEFPNATARIDGHTDNTGPLALNQRLSLARANSVKTALVNEYNIDASRLTTKGFAWDQPIASNATAEGRAMNRRVFATISGSRTVVADVVQ
jgi:OmpA-OmpF porin, OOP family